jgi:hypothetical protein
VGAFAEAPPPRPPRALSPTPEDDAAPVLRRANVAGKVPPAPLAKPRTASQIADINATHSNVVLGGNAPTGQLPGVAQRSKAPKRLSVRGGVTQWSKAEAAYLRGDHLQGKAATQPGAAPTKQAEKHHVIVQVGSDQVSRDAARKLAGKHPASSTQYVVKDGQLVSVLKKNPDVLPGQQLKVQVVGLGDDKGKTISGADYKSVVNIIKRVAKEAGQKVDKVSLAGCNTDSCLVNKVDRKLPNTVVTGFTGRRGVIDGGHKVDLTPEENGALLVDKTAGKPEKVKVKAPSK